MSTVYSSETLPGDRRKGWQELISEIYAHLDIEIPARRCFFGRIRCTNVGDLELTEVLTDSERANRTARHIARDRRDSYLYLLVRQGELSVTQFNRHCTIRAGEFTLVHLNSPYVFQHDERVDKIGLKFPAFMLRIRPGRLAEHCAVPRSAAHGIAHLAAGYVHGLCQEGANVSHEVGYALSRATSDLFAVMLGSIDSPTLPDETAVRAALRRRCASYIAAHCADPDLDPSAIAGAMGISVRYLHRCFESAELSVMEYLLQQRLQRCHADLGNPCCDGLPIAEIALRNGFCNVCHFNDVFKTRYGVAPRQIRRERAGRSWSPT